MWTTRQCMVLATITVGLATYLAIRASRDSVDLSPQSPQDDPQIMAQLADRLDPNTAPWESLAALPNLGQRRAHDIVAYREKVQHEFPARIPFARPDDLMRVNGIGTATVANLRPYLVFPTSAPAGGP
jgi:DNA uptake protein ComE-like DNA-binding protein